MYPRAVSASGRGSSGDESIVCEWADAPCVETWLVVRALRRLLGVALALLALKLILIAAGVLLLLPAVGDADLPHDAEELVAAAVTAVGGEWRYRREVAGGPMTASRRFWDAPAWTDHAGHRV